ncbi:hypothetical protein DM298_04440 [Lactobacillus amylovorus]|uniref:Uncharacterized protein n=1 Tax=Lactobacillus amylovorus TaxID=1604 RepID=A0A5B8ECR7_LACAM|nr:hypothetical protein [Lactobacillus amylovorus]QDD70209.1 hypothetical protein DM298_04440 [Lactobacillus amylovorus]
MTLKKNGNIDFNKITKELKYLKTHEVQIGFWGDRDGHLLTIVRANEYGAKIVPHNKSGKLWIPSREAIKRYGKSVKPSDVKDLFVAGSKKVNGKKVLGKSAGITENGKYVVLFYLLDHVRIPARPFLRKAFYDNQHKYRRLVKVGIDEIVYDDKTGHDLLVKLGKAGVSDVRESIRRWTKPGNAPLTIDNKRGQNNPLVDTGKLSQAVTYKIVRV